MEMYNPAHPGQILLEEFLPNVFKITITDFAKHLKISRGSISKVLHGKAPITPRLAWRLELAGVSSAQLWLSLQNQYDLWHVKQNNDIPKIPRLTPYSDLEEKSNESLLNNDDDILKIAEYRITNPDKTIAVDIDDL